MLHHAGQALEHRLDPFRILDRAEGDVVDDIPVVGEKGRFGGSAQDDWNLESGVHQRMDDPPRGGGVTVRL